MRVAKPVEGSDKRRAASLCMHGPLTFGQLSRADIAHDRSEPAWAGMVWLTNEPQGDYLARGRTISLDLPLPSEEPKF